MQENDQDIHDDTSGGTTPFYESRGLQHAMRRIIRAAGDDPNREGLRETPRRFLKALHQFLNPDPFELTTFEDGDYNEMVIVKNIPFFSMCEHHMAPFFGTASIAYIPNGRIVGLSKLPRTLEKFAHRLQNQERITKQVTDFLDVALTPKGVACVITARHLCMEMRGVKTHDAHTVTSSLCGVFKEPAVRAEFMSLIN